MGQVVYACSSWRDWGQEGGSFRSGKMAGWVLLELIFKGEKLVCKLEGGNIKQFGFGGFCCLF